MDIKKLLLLQQVIPIMRYQRLIVNNKRYSICFVLKQNILTVLKIKRIRNKNTLRRQLKVKKKNFIRTLMRRRAEAIKNRQPKYFNNSGVQTTYIDKMNVSVGTPIINKFDQRTNTRTIYMSKAAVQTDIFRSSISTQVRIPCHGRSTQTFIELNVMGTQTEVLLCHKESQTEVDALDAKELENHFIQVSHILTEVSRMVLHQNSLIQNNSTLLGHLSDIAILRKYSEKKKANEIKNCWVYSFIHQKRKLSSIYTVNSRKKQCICESEDVLDVFLVDMGMQTDNMQIDNKLTQTISRSTFFPTFFKGNSSSKNMLQEVM